MYCAFKTFRSFNEAIQALTNASGSLAQSDLGTFQGENFEEVMESIREYEEKEYAWAEVWMGNDGYCQSLMDDLGMAPPNSAEEERGIEVFNYTTASGINRVTIREVQADDGTIKGYEAVYRVESGTPIEYSSAMRSFKREGWKCSEKTYTDRDGATWLSDEEARQQREDYEREIIERMRSFREIPDIFFGVSFEQGADVSHIISHAMANDPSTITTLLKNHPELRDEVIEIINEQLAEIKKIEIPTTYEFNESMYEDSNFYVERRDATIQTLTLIRDELLKTKLPSQTAALAALEEKEQTISATEELIEGQTPLQTPPTPM